MNDLSSYEIAGIFGITMAFLKLFEVVVKGLFSVIKTLLSRNEKKEEIHDNTTLACVQRFATIEKSIDSKVDEKVCKATQNTIQTNHSNLDKKIDVLFDKADINHELLTEVKTDIALVKVDIALVKKGVNGDA